MLKIINKSELGYEAGYIVDADKNIVGVDSRIFRLMDKLEEMKQKTEWLIAKNACSNIPELPEFEFQSMHNKVTKMITFEAATPELDKLVKRATTIMKELDFVEIEKKVDRDLQWFEPLIEWVASDTVIVSEAASHCHRFDTAFLGNPLELTKEDVVNTIIDYEIAEHGLNLEQCCVKDITMPDEDEEE